MPMYEYECQTCGKRIEALQSFKDPPLEACDCGDEGPLKKLISAPAFQFKGSGWYVTDYADKSKKSDQGGQESKPDGGGSSGGEPSSGKSDAGKTPDAKSTSEPKSSSPSSGSDGKTA